MQEKNKKYRVFHDFYAKYMVMCGLHPFNLRHSCTFEDIPRKSRVPRIYGRKLQRIHYFFCPKMHFFLKKFAYVQFL